MVRGSGFRGLGIGFVTKLYLKLPGILHKIPPQQGVRMQLVAFITQTALPPASLASIGLLKIVRNLAQLMILQI